MQTEDVILLIEDSIDDVLIMQRALRALQVANPLVVLHRSEQAVEYLTPKEKAIDGRGSPLPQLIVLDLKLPGMDGFEFLGWIRTQPELKHLPVVVITSSPYSADLRQAYQAGANSFLTKTADFSQFKASLREVTEYWLPKREPSTVEQVQVGQTINAS